MTGKIGLLVVLVLLAAGCAPLNVPDPSPDGRAPVPANGIIEHPVRPKGIPDNFGAFTWIVEVEDNRGRPYPGSADVEVHATAAAPIQGSVHGPYPFRIWTGLPYSHTIWFQPGIVIETDVWASARPELGVDDFNAGIRLVCTGAILGQDQPVDGVVEVPQVDPEVARCSYTIGG